MSLKTYTEARAHRAGSHLVTGCTGGCHFDTVRCGQGGRGLSLWWPYGLRLPDLVYILSFLFIMNITEMIGISLRIVLRFFHDLMFLLCWEIKNSWFLRIPDSWYPDLGHQMVMVMNNLLPPPLCNVNRPSHSEIQLFQISNTAISKFDHENPWSRSCVWSKVKVMFDLENSKVKVMVKVKPNGHIWGLGVQSLCLLFVSLQLDHFWLRYSKFCIWLENARSRSWQRSNPMVTFEP